MHPRRTLRGWLLWLALLLPIAQAMAAAHAFAHVGERPQDGAAHAAACDLCVAAAQLAGAAPVAMPALPAVQPAATAVAWPPAPAPAPAAAWRPPARAPPASA